MTRRVLVTVAALPLLAAAEVWRRGLAAPLIFGCGAWADALLGYRPVTAATEPEVVG